MTTHATLDSAALQAVPGEASTCQLIVRNTGDLVEAYELAVVGDAAPWASVEPATITLYPGTETAATVIFTPPRSPLVPAGERPFAVRVIPSEQPEDAVAPEGTVDVGPFYDTGAEIIPRTSKGTYRGQHEVAVDNRGNVPVAVAVTAADPDGRLAFRTRPRTLTVLPGQAAFVDLALRNQRVLWRGQPITHPFEVTVSPDDGPPIVLNAATVQTPILARAAGRLAGALAALLLLLLAGWFLLVKPAVSDAAEQAAAQAVKEPLAQVSQQANDAGQKAQAADEKADAAGADAAAANAAAAKPTATAAPARRITTAPTQLRLATTVAPGTASGTDRFTVPARTTLIITDLVLENPQGDTGRVDVLIDGNPVLTYALANFRATDYHFVSPLEVPTGKALSLRSTCQAVGTDLGPADNRCRASLLVSGSRRVVAPPPTPAP